MKQLNKEQIKGYLVNLIPLFVIGIIGVAIDQITKFIARETLVYEGNSKPLINNFFSFTLAFNPGAAWSILEDQMTFFYIITVIVLIAVIYFYLKQQHPFGRLCYSLIFPGAIGNFIDRLYAKEVTDFLHFELIDFPIFNVADILLVVGTIMLIYFLIFIEDKHED